MKQRAIPPRASRTQDFVPPDREADEREVPDSYYTTRLPTSTRRYHDTRGNQVIEQGNRRIVIHEAPPPKHRPHGLLILGLGMLLMLLLYVGFQLLGNWWTEHQLEATYGFPRTYQEDAIVYPGDTSATPSHYIFLNLNGVVEIIELPHSDSAHTRIYKGPTVLSDHAALVPITGEFKNVGGKVEMIVHVQNEVIIYINDGTQFKPQQ